MGRPVRGGRRLTRVWLHRAVLDGRIQELRRFTGAGYDKGRPVSWQIAWLVVQNLVFRGWWLPMRARPAILRWFGASVGEGCRIRQDVRVHWPWKLSMGDGCWLGEGAWILNLEPVTLGSAVCISQEALICTGSHDASSPTFDFDNAPITIGQGAWVCARAIVLRGATVAAGEVVPAGTVRRGSEPG